MRLVLRHVNLLIAAGLTLALASACATTPAPRAINATELRAQANEALKVDRALLLVDVSGSIDERTQFPDAKALVSAFVEGMPEGNYQTGMIAFGGDERETLALAPFSRSTVASSVSSLTHLGEDTKLPNVINEAHVQLAGVTGDSAIVLFSDGLPTQAGREQPGSHTLAAAKQLLEAQSGNVCFHTVQVGDDLVGAELLQQLAELTPCGSTRNANSIDNGSNLLIAQRSIFLGETLPTVAAAPAPGDRDRDGIADNRDRCPRTPIGAEVDPRGCWVLTGLHFALDSDAIGSRSTDDLNGVANVLRSNPKLRIRIDGYTDSSGAETYNQALSERRARAVQGYLESAGIDADRLDARGHGESSPIADNSTSEGRALNRRSELIRVD